MFIITSSAVLLFVILLAIIGTVRLVVQKLLPSAERIGFIGVLLGIFSVLLIFKVILIINPLAETIAYIALAVLIWNGLRAILGRTGRIPTINPWQKLLSRKAAS